MQCRSSVAIRDSHQTDRGNDFLIRMRSLDRVKGPIRVGTGIGVISVCRGKVTGTELHEIRTNDETMRLP